MCAHVASILWFIGVKRMDTDFVAKCKNWKSCCNDASENVETEEE